MSIDIEVPASSANLGVGFDCLALALDMHLRVSVEPAATTSLELEGEGSGRLSVGRSNRFLAGLAAGWREVQSGPAPNVRIEMRNEIPLGRGLGSSAAATVAGLLAAQAFARADLGNDRLIAMAASIEGHPDNAAAALLGGFVVVAGGRATSLEPPASLRCVVFVPELELATADMRAVLPAMVPLADAVANAGGVGALVAAFATGDLSLLRAMNDDRLHEPYRATVYPELPAMKAAAVDAGALGAALSGAGSSILALVEGPKADGVARALAATAEQLRLAGSVRIVTPSAAGASVNAG